MSSKFHRYSWWAEFCGAVRHHRANTIQTVPLAIAGRRILFEIAEREAVEFDLKKCGILHLYYDKTTFDVTTRGNELLQAVGLNRYPVTLLDIRSIESALHGRFYGRFYASEDAAGEIHKFTRGFAKARIHNGVTFVENSCVIRIESGTSHVIRIHNNETGVFEPNQVDVVVIRAGVHIRGLEAFLGDLTNNYPIKGYSITVCVNQPEGRAAAPGVSLIYESANIANSRLGADLFCAAGSAESKGYNRDIQADRVAPLEKWFRHILTSMSTSAAIPWAGLRSRTPNMMTRVGCSNRRHVYCNTGRGQLGQALSAPIADLINHSAHEDLRGGQS
jgi:D-amino-acid dehydrogenase